MNKKFGLYIVVGMAIGAIFGGFFVPTTGNALFSVALGAIGGVFIGWFVAAFAQERKER